MNRRTEVKFIPREEIKGSVRGIVGVFLATAGDPKAGMTLDELLRFAQTAREAGVTGDEVVRIETTWRNSIKRVAVKLNVDTG